MLLRQQQVLKYETYQDSPLVRMLLRRAILAPYRIGHPLFWLLKSEMYRKEVAPRFGLLLILYIQHCGPHRTHLRRQAFVNDKIRVIADQVTTVAACCRCSTTAIHPHCSSHCCGCVDRRC